MNDCRQCQHQSRCRVPGDLQRFSRVVDRLDHDGRAPNLQRRLRHYIDTTDCLVDAGYVDL